MSRSDILRIPDYLEHIIEAIEHIDQPVWCIPCTNSNGASNAPYNIPD